MSSNGRACRLVLLQHQPNGGLRGVVDGVVLLSVHFILVFEFIILASKWHYRLFPGLSVRICFLITLNISISRHHGVQKTLHQILLPILLGALLASTFDYRPGLLLVPRSFLILPSYSWQLIKCIYVSCFCCCLRCDHVVRQTRHWLNLFFV